MANQPAVALALNPTKLAGTPLRDSKANPIDHATKPAIIALLPTPGRACWLGKNSASVIGTNNETSTSTNDNSKSPMIDSPENATASEPAITNPTLALVPQTLVPQTLATQSESPPAESRTNPRSGMITFRETIDA
jgi:hypothetical protein